MRHCVVCKQRSLDKETYISIKSIRGALESTSTACKLPCMCVSYMDQRVRACVDREYEGKQFTHAYLFAELDDLSSHILRLISR